MNRRFLIPSLIYILFFTLVQIARFNCYQANAYDLSFITQGLWSTVHGAGFLHLSMFHESSYLGEHFSPILAVLSPLFLLPHPEHFLFFMQALLVCSGTYFLWKICELKSFSQNSTFLVLLLYLLYSPLWQSNLFDFREDAFFIPCLFGLILAKENKSNSLLWVFALLCLTVKENAAIPLFGMGVWLMTDGRRIQGATLAIVSASFFLILNGLVMPLFVADHHTTMAVTKFSGLGQDVGSILKTFLRSPLQSAFLILGVMFDAASLSYIARIFLPFAPLLVFINRKNFLPLLIAVGLVLMNLLINSTHSVGFHYELILIPFLFLFLIQNLPQLFNRIGVRPAAFVMILFSVASYRVSPFRVFHDFKMKPEYEKLTELLKNVPDSASISTQTSLHPHLCYRKIARIFSDAASLHEDYVVLSVLPGLSQYGHPNLREEMKKIEPQGYRLMINQPEAQIWCRADVDCKSP